MWKVISSHSLVCVACSILWGMWCLLSVCVIFCLCSFSVFISYWLVVSSLMSCVFGDSLM